jgi:hypothetical protein
VGIRAREKERQRKREIKAWPKDTFIRIELMEAIRDPEKHPTITETEALRAIISLYEALQEVDPENALLVSPQLWDECSDVDDDIAITTQLEFELPTMPPESPRDQTPPNFYELQEALSSESAFG